MMLRFINTILISFTILIGASLPALAAANNQLFSPCDINSKTAKSPICPDRNTTTNPVNEKIKVAAGIVAIATGVAAVIFIIIGGITMITSAGNSEGVANARKRIAYAVLGLVIVALAYTMVAFVTDRFIK